MFNIRKVKRDRRSSDADWIGMSSDIYLETNKKIDIDNTVFRMIIVFLTSISAVFMGMGFIDLKTGGELLLIVYACAVTVLYCSLLSKNSKVRNMCSVIIILQAVFLAYTMKMVKYGLCLIVNKYCDTIGYNDIFTDEIDISGGSEKIYMFFAAMFVLTFVIAGVSIACYHKTSFILAFILTFPFFEIGAFWGLVPNYLLFSVLLVCWICIFSMQMTSWNSVNSRSNASYHLKRRSNNFYVSSKPLIQYSGNGTAKCIALVSVFVLLFVYFVGGLLTKRPEKIDKIRNDVKNYVQNFSLRELPEMVENIYYDLDIFPIKSVGGTNGGKLGRSGNLSFTGVDALTVTISGYCPPGPIYLKGYCGGKYTGNSWDQLDSSAYDDDYLFKKYEEDCYQNYNSSIIEEYYNKNGSAVPVSKAEISIKSASKSIFYEPYSSIHNSGGKDYELTKDSYLKSRSDNYSIMFYPDFMNLDSIKNFDSVISRYSSYSPYSIIEINNTYTSNVKYNVYATFVQKNYIKFDAESIRQAYNEIARNYLSLPVPDDYDCVNDGFFNVNGFISPGETADGIQRYFAENYRYSLTPGKTPSGEDFVEYFLNVQKEGYCSYFASAGTLLMRAFGIPARFAEGYVALNDDFSRSEDMMVSKATLTDKAAHAWCEAFIPSIGWVPVEFTPGFTGSVNPNIAPDVQTETSTTTTEPPLPDDTATSTTTKAVTDADSSTVTTTTDPNNSSADVTVSSSHSSSSTGDDPSDENEISYEMIFKAMLKMAVFAAIILLILAIWGRIRIIKLASFNKKINNKNRNKAVIEIYKRYLSLLELIGIDTENNITDLSSVENISKQCYDMNIVNMVTDFKRLTEIAVEADMSQNQISKSDHEFALKELERITEVVWSRLGRFDAFKAKYIKFYY